MPLELYASIRASRGLVCRCRYFPTSPIVIQQISGPKPIPCRGKRKESGGACIPSPARRKSRPRRSARTGVTYYLPQVVKESRTPQGRKLRSVVPLFSSYIFLYGDANDRLAAFRGDRLVNVLPVVDQQGLVRDLRQVYTMLNSGLSVCPNQLMPVGAKVRIMTGPLTGITGTVIRRGNRDQFVAVVNFLGVGATVDLEDWQVEQVNPDGVVFQQYPYKAPIEAIHPSIKDRRHGTAASSADEGSIPLRIRDAASAYRRDFSSRSSGS